MQPVTWFIVLKERSSVKSRKNEMVTYDTATNWPARGVSANALVQSSRRLISARIYWLSRSAAI
jgi:hypothetical protein